jgi:hypothetical protein
MKAEKYYAWGVKWCYARTVISQEAGGNGRNGGTSVGTGSVDSETRNCDMKGPLRVRQSGGNFISSLGSMSLMTMRIRPKREDMRIA